MEKWDKKIEWVGAFGLTQYMSNTISCSLSLHNLAPLTFLNPALHFSRRTAPSTFFYYHLPTPHTFCHTNANNFLPLDAMKLLCFYAVSSISYTSHLVLSSLSSKPPLTPLRPHSFPLNALVPIHSSNPYQQPNAMTANAQNTSSSQP